MENQLQNKHLQGDPTSIMAPGNIFQVTFSRNISKSLISGSLTDPASWKSYKQQVQQRAQDPVLRETGIQHNFRSVLTSM